MSGFAHIGEYVDAHLNGQTSFCSFRKVPSQATTFNRWADLSMTTGNPPANYYAATPATAAVLDGARGIFHGPSALPAHKYLSRMCLQTPTLGLAGQYMLLDYLLYYPFIDGDDADVQTMDNTVTLPRYTDGAGVQAMLVCVAPTAGGGVFTFTYVNQDGVTKTSPPNYCTNAANIASLITTNFPLAGPSFGPFLTLADGDTGIRSIVSFSNTVLNGGLSTIVLVKPIADLVIREINTPAEFSFCDVRGPSARIYDGAYLNLIVNCIATIAGGSLTGFGQFVWG